MISGWLVKILLGFALLGLVAYELGTPLVMKAQVDGIAHEAADDAGVDLLQNHSADRAQALAEQDATAKGGHIPEGGFVVLDDSRVRVTVEKQAGSLLLKRWDVTKSWYDVKVTATSQKRGTQ